MSQEVLIRETDYPPGSFRRLQPGITVSRLNTGLFDFGSNQLIAAEFKISPEVDNTWLPGEVAIPQPETSPTIIIGSNSNSDLRIGYGLKPISDVIEKGEDGAPALSFDAALGEMAKAKKAMGITHLVERDDETLPNSILQISFHRRGALVVAYGREIDIVAKTIHGKGLPAALVTPLQGTVDDYSEEDKKYDRLHPTIMWQDTKTGMTLKDNLDWKTSGRESTILSNNDNVIIFNSAKRRYAVKIIQGTNTSRTPYHWDRMIVYKSYSPDTQDDSIFDDLCPKTNADETESV